MKPKPSLPNPPKFDGNRQKFRVWELEMKEKLHNDSEAIGTDRHAPQRPGHPPCRVVFHHRPQGLNPLSDDFYKTELKRLGYPASEIETLQARVYAERKRSFVGQHFWARGYFVSTVGRDEAVIREYIKHQEREDMRLDQMKLWT